MELEWWACIWTDKIQGKILLSLCEMWKVDTQVGANICTYICVMIYITTMPKCGEGWSRTLCWHFCPQNQSEEVMLRQFRSTGPAPLHLAMQILLLQKKWGCWTTKFNLLSSSLREWVCCGKPALNHPEMAQNLGSAWHKAFKISKGVGDPLFRDTRFI